MTQLRKFLAFQNKVYRLSDENFFAILFPLDLGVVLFLTGLLLAYVSDTFDAFARSLLAFGIICAGISGFVSAVKKEIPGDPQARGTIKAVFIGGLEAIGLIGLGVAFLVVPV